MAKHGVIGGGMLFQLEGFGDIAADRGFVLGQDWRGPRDRAGRSGEDAHRSAVAIDYHQGPTEARDMVSRAARTGLSGTTVTGLRLPCRSER